MPYSTSNKNGKVTVYKDVGGHSKVVGHTTKRKKRAYLAALYKNSKDNNMKPSKKNETINGSIDQLFGVKSPYDDCKPTELVFTINPLEGVPTETVPHQNVVATFADQQEAMHFAEGLYKEFCINQQALEEKKITVTNKLKEMMGILEKKRSSCMEMIKENPMDSRKMKHEIAQITEKIDGLMEKLETIERSKRDLKKKEKKENNKN